MKSTLREGADSADRESSRTASSAVSHAPSSPLPWKLHYTNKWKNRGQNIYVRAANGLYVTEQILDEADAVFVVRACNHHEALLAALKDVRAWLCDGGPIQDDGITHPLFVKANNAVHAAIANAEEN